MILGLVPISDQSITPESVTSLVQFCYSWIVLFFDFLRNWFSNFFAFTGELLNYFLLLYYDNTKRIFDLFFSLVSATRVFTPIIIISKGFFSMITFVYSYIPSLSSTSAVLLSLLVGFQPDNNSLSPLILYIVDSILILYLVASTFGSLLESYLVVSFQMYYKHTGTFTPFLILIGALFLLLCSSLPLVVWILGLTVLDITEFFQSTPDFLNSSLIRFYRIIFLCTYVWHIFGGAPIVFFLFERVKAFAIFLARFVVSIINLVVVAYSVLMKRLSRTPSVIEPTKRRVTMAALTDLDKLEIDRSYIQSSLSIEPDLQLLEARPAPLTSVKQKSVFSKFPDNLIKNDSLLNDFQHKNSPPRSHMKKLSLMRSISLPDTSKK